MPPSAPLATNLAESLSPTDHNNDTFTGKEVVAAATAAAAAARTMTSPTQTIHKLPTKCACTAKKNCWLGATTARKLKKTKASTSIKNGFRLFPTCKSLVVSEILTEQQKVALKQCPQSFRFYGANLMGTSKTGYDVECDSLPKDQKVVLGIGRGCL